jgi:hypothetical protein
VDYTEYQRMLNDNKYTPITSYITEGYGPIKPYLTVETTQPIPVENKQYAAGQEPTFQMAFQAKNKGSGFLSNLFSNYDSTGKETQIIKIRNQDINVLSNAGTTGSTSTYNLGDLVSKKIRGDSTAGNNGIGDLQLIGTESPKQTFSIEAPFRNKIEKVATYYVTSSIDYMYEFRKEIKVTIKPPAITS